MRISERALRKLIMWLISSFLAMLALALVLQMVNSRFAYIEDHGRETVMIADATAAAIRLAVNGDISNGHTPQPAAQLNIKDYWSLALWKTGRQFAIASAPVKSSRRRRRMPRCWASA